MNKHVDFFNPTKYKEPIHIIGLGAVGSNLLNQLVRLGFDTFYLYDFDTVSPHNITNQLYTQSDIGKLKIDAITEHMLQINPDITIIKDPKGWDKTKNIHGVLFSCVDSIELRKKLFESNRNNINIKYVTDIRIGLEEAQMYAEQWSKKAYKDRIISTMQFKKEEVEVPVSACGTVLSVLPTIQMVVSLGVMNFINFIKNGTYNYQSILDSIKGVSVSFKN